MVHIQFAKQIVETLKSICDHNINYIDINGRIYASTDEIRVGNYHDAGHEAAKTGKTITVEEDDISRGAKKGINMPIRFHGKDQRYRRRRASIRFPCVRRRAR